MLRFLKIRSSSQVYRFQIGLAILGTAISLYLLLQHTRLRAGIQESASVCSMGRFADCDVVNASQYSEFWGIPLASLGAAFYFAVFLTSLLAAPPDKFFRLCQRWVSLGAVVALGVDLALLVLQLFWLKNFCLFCFLTYGVSFGLFWTSLRLQNLSLFPLGVLSKRLFNFSELLTPPPTKLLFFQLLALLLFFITLDLIPDRIRLQSQTYSMIDKSLLQYYDKWRELPIRKIPVFPEDGAQGNPDASIQIVEFSDFECPFCRKAAFTLHAALKPLGDRVHFVFKHFPLDSQCNTRLKYEMHPNACRLARLATCAQSKGLFWKFHDRAFMELKESDLTDKSDALFTHFEDLLSREEALKCLHNSRSRVPLDRDIQEANNLGIEGTPSIFINGKQVKIPLTIQNLQKLIEIESSLK